MILADCSRKLHRPSTYQYRLLCTCFQVSVEISNPVRRTELVEFLMFWTSQVMRNRTIVVNLYILDLILRCSLDKLSYFRFFLRITENPAVYWTEFLLLLQFSAITDYLSVFLSLLWQEETDMNKILLQQLGRKSNLM